MKYTVILILSVLAFTACFEAPSFDEVPFITSAVTVSDTSVVTPDNIVEFRISFEDGNGDLGRQRDDSTSRNIFLYDLNLDIIDSITYFIPFIPPKGSVDDISGTINIQVEGPSFNGRVFDNCFTGSMGKIDTIFFEVQIRDRAGNMSNRVSLTPLVIDCR